MLTVLALYIQLGAALANRVSSDQNQIYLDAATAGWDWFFNIGVVNSDHYVVDGVDKTTCKPTGTIYSYNQGVILGAAAELYQATGNGTYLDLAGNIATAVTTKNSTLTNANGILMDSCDRTTSCSGDGAEFKGPFVKNLRKLQLARGNPQWLNFLETNAQSIWNNDLNISNGDCLVGEYWAGPYTTADAVSQGIALDALVAALAVTS
jgi:predicted alpha-1,6-mannanase (GH76 family)